MIINNPFTVYSPEDLDTKRFKELFVKETTWIQALETPKDTIIIGNRGSGKSMYLNYLELSHQLCYYNHDLSKFISEVRDKYIGIYIQASHEGYNIDRYEFLENITQNKEFVINLCRHHLIMNIIYNILKTITQPGFQSIINKIHIEILKDFFLKKIKGFDRRNRYSELREENYENHYKIFKKFMEICFDEMEEIKYYSNDKFQDKEINYTGNYCETNFLLEFIKDLKSILELQDFSFYILIDNAEVMRISMQEIIKELIELRAHKDFCIKVAIKKGKEWNFEGIDDPHDYTKINVNELYSNLQGIYYTRIREIVMRRLELNNIKKPIEEFLPEKVSEERLREEIKEELRVENEEKYDKEFKDAEISPDKNKWVNNRINKYLEVKLFRNLGKTGKSYAGFKNIVHISSGIVRQFLDICSFLFNLQKKKSKKGFESISVKIQEDGIKNYADIFLENNVKSFYVDATHPRQQGNTQSYNDLYILIQALGKYYRKRLLDPKISDARLFSFTLKDPEKNQYIVSLLNLGITCNCFQDYWYSTKTGIGRIKGYAFNRILCVRYSLDPTSFRGRVELKTSDLEKAIETGILPKRNLEIEKGQTKLEKFKGD